jgi:hypothetical protein
MENYSFADEHGSSITEGLQCDDPERFAQEWLERTPGATCVEYWLTGDEGVDGDACESLVTVWR